MDRYSYEIRLLNTPKSNRGRWRWDLIVQKQVDGLHPGVLDNRIHMTTRCGYTRTKWGALREISKAYDEVQGRYPIYG